MARKLIIRLKNTSTDTPELEWNYLDNNGRSHFPTPLELTEVIQKSDQIIVLIPGEDVLITEVQLPKLSANQLAKALPFALEDQLAEDPQTLHFAAGLAPKGGPIPVAVVAKEKMNAWIALLREHLSQAFSKVKAIIPDTLALPYHTNHYFALVNHHLALVRTGTSSGFAIDKANLFSIFDLMFKRPNQTKPEKIIVVANETVFTPEQEKLLDVPFENKPAPSNALALLTETIAETYPINLLQGSFATKQKFLSFEQLIKAAAALAIALIALVFVEDIISFLILAHVQRKINNEAQVIYHAVYPNASVPANPKTSLEDELTRLRAQHADSIFLRLVNLIEAPVRSLIVQGLILKEADFSNNQMILNIETQDSTLVEGLQKQLDALGLKTTVKSAQRAANGLIDTRLTIEEMS